MLAIAIALLAPLGDFVIKLFSMYQGMMKPVNVEVTKSVPIPTLQSTESAVYDDLGLSGGRKPPET